jgi:aminoglycoside/choline kinase family phosphotransferase
VTERPAQELERRLAAWLGRSGRDAARISPLAGDVSARRYFRVTDRRGATFVAVAYPPQLAASQRRFAAASVLLGRAGVRTPEILLDDPEAGLALLEDLGAATLYELPDLAPERRQAYLEAATAAAARIAALDPAEVAALGSPPLDRPLLRRELEATEELFFVPRALAGAGLSKALDRLCVELAAAPLRPCHRDFMVRNLIPMPDGEVGVLDFQDLRLGPASYDLASLLNDSWFAPEPFERLHVGRMLPGPELGEQYRRAVVQRSLKAVGTFLAFAARGEPRHLPLVAPTLRRAFPHLARLPETAELWHGLEAPLRKASETVAIC